MAEPMEPMKTNRINRKAFDWTVDEHSDESCQTQSQKIQNTFFQKKPMNEETV